MCQAFVLSSKVKPLISPPLPNSVPFIFKTQIKKRAGVFVLFCFFLVDFLDLFHFMKKLFLIAPTTTEYIFIKSLASLLVWFLVFLSIELEQQFLTCVLWRTGVPQGFLKHAVPDYVVRDTDLFSFRFSNFKNDSNQYNSHPVWMNQNYTYFFSDRQKYIFDVPKNFSN